MMTSNAGSVVELWPRNRTGKIFQMVVIAHPN